MRKTLVFVVLVAVGGCSSSSSEDHNAHGSSSSSGSGSTSSSSSGGTSTSGTPAASLKAPTLDTVEKMMGALHVMWTNSDSGCDSVVGERKAEMADGTVHEPYKEVFSVPGEADNKHDTSATDDMKYTYRLRCKKGDAFSAYSNEKGLNPVQ